MPSHKVLFVTDSLGNGGLERQLSLLVKYYPKDWECKVWSLNDGPFVERIRGMGSQVELCRRAWRFDIMPALRLWRLLLEWRPDIVHSWGWMASLSAIPACKLLGIPAVDGTIRMGATSPSPVPFWRMGMHLADTVVANSFAGLRAYDIRPGRGRVVYNGFDPDRLNHCIYQRCRGDSVDVVMTGRMELWAKDYKAFFVAARKVVALDKGKWRFIAVGNGVDRDGIVSEASDLVAAGCAGFPEAGLEVLPIVGQSHIGVLLTPSTHGEGCSNSIMEYMACGLPVICNDVGGNRELVLNGETGFLIPRGDIHALVEKLIYLKENENEAKRLGLAGRDRLLQHFSVQAMVNGMLAIYGELLQGRRHLPMARNKLSFLA